MNEGRHLALAKRNYQEEIIRLINYPDFMLYDHFNTTFWAKINQIGLERIEKMADEIRVLSQKLEDDCVRGSRSLKEMQKIYFNFIKPIVILHRNRIICIPLWDENSTQK